MYTDLFLDGGRSNTRYLIDHRTRHIQPSMLAEITAADYDAILDSKNQKLIDNTFIVSTDWDNGTTEPRFFVIGKGADQYKLMGTAQSAERYTRDYIGVIAATGAIRMYQRSVQNLRVWSCYPPIDRRYKPTLVNAIKGDYTVVWNDRDYVVNAQSVLVEAEPIAALYNFAFRADGDPYRLQELTAGKTITLDGGGRTFDISVTDEQFDVQPNMLQSDDDIALNDTLAAFQEDIRAMYPEVFRGGGRSINLSQWYDAFVTGDIMLAGREVDVSQTRDKHRNAYANAVLRKLDSVGGLAGYANVNIAGGWALLFRDIDWQNYLQHYNVNMCLGVGQTLEEDLLYSQVSGLYKFSLARKKAR